MPDPVTTTTVILARHAERSSQGGSNPQLTVEGRKRAQKLIHVLGTADVKAIYTSQLIRTKETAQPLAARLGLSPVVIDEAPQIKNDIMKNHSGKTVLVIGHTDTVPELISLLSGISPPVIGNGEFDNLFVVTVSSSGGTSVVRLKYGEASLI